MMSTLRKAAGLFLLFIVVLGLQTAAGAQAEAYQVIGHTELKALVDADMRNFLLVDARNPEEYREAHIPGAVNIPQKKMDNLLGLLPADKRVRIIYYCNGVKCGKSKKAAIKSMEMGYTNVWVYAEGMPVWEEMGYSFYKGGDYEKKIETTKIVPQDLKKMMDTEPDSVTVVDVRDPEEFAEGHIPGAINLPLQNFASGSGVLDKDKKIVVYCNSGGRSYGAYKKLMKLGYKNIYQAIFADWKEAHLPVAG
ncbi:MAG: sulfurtransferase [Desulfobacterales bacterium SG8_35]|nr:MAG: sulfurtransferase [Desulfobacterales bacterium SG8_35]